MLNLVQLTQHRVEVSKESGPVLVSTDPLTDTVYFANSSSIWAVSNNQKIWSCPLVEDCPVGIHFLTELDALFVVFGSGDAVVVREGVQEERISTTEPILAVQWSPEEDVCVIVTKTSHIILFNLVTLESVLETQMMMETGDEQSVEFVWRGDGQYFAISFMRSQQRSVAIFERASLQLKSLIEDRRDLSKVMDWQPNGRHLYLTSMNEEEFSPEVLLYEVNGLPHGSFCLRSKGLSVHSMKWNLDSGLLAVILSHPSIWKIQIWRRNNWHWYLKFERCFEEEIQSIKPFWDIDETCKLHFVVERTSSIDLYSMNFAFEYSVSSCGTSAVIDGSYLKLTPLKWVEIPPPLAAATVEFGGPIQSIAFSASSDEQIAAVLSNNQLQIIHCDHRDRWDDDLDAKDLENDDEIEDVFLKPQKSLDLSSLLGLEYTQAILWIDESYLALFGKVKQGQDLKDVLFLLNLDKMDQLESIKPQSLPFALLKPIGYQDSSLYLQSIDGEVYIGKLENENFIFSLFLTLPVACPMALLINLETGVKIAGLASNGKVYFENDVIHERVTSMIQRQIQGSHFLLLTTKDNQLIFKDLQRSSKLHSQHGHSDLDQLQAKIGGLSNGGLKPGPKKRGGGLSGAQGSIFQRSIELGARLIASPGGSTKVIFQMPRGNLETIHPRLFVLLEIIASLKDKTYKTAWKLATENRVDLNAIVDFDLDQFIDDIPHFIDALSSPDDVCDLVIALHEDSVFDSGGGLYHGCCCLVNQSTRKESKESTKINRICSELRSWMMELDDVKYSKAIVISFSKSCPPQLKEALEFIKSMKLKELAGSKDPSSNLAGDTLKFLMLYIDVSDLYRVALSVYDLDLAYMVITHAQRDPGEYLNELQRFLEVQNDHYRFALVDLHLQRHQKALEHLVLAGTSHLEEAIDLAREQGLFHELLGRLEDREEDQKVVLVQYGDWLKRRGMMEDAGAAFLAAKELQIALDTYQSSGEWKMAFIIGQRLHLSSEELQDLYSETYEELRSMGKIIDAANVALEYLNEVEEAILLFIEARQWKEAMRLSYHWNKEFLIDAQLAPSAASAVQSYVEDFEEITESISNYHKRLIQVREKREAMESAIGDTGFTQEEETASTVAGLSIYTERTTPERPTFTSDTSAALTTGGRKPKKATKTKKRNFKIKQGSPEEETALELHLKELRPKEEVLKEVSELNEVLIGLGYLNDARKLQTSLDSLLKLQKSVSGPIGGEELRWKWDILRTV